MRGRATDSPPSSPPNVAPSVGWQLGEGQDAAWSSERAPKPRGNVAPTERVPREQCTQTAQVTALRGAIEQDDRRHNEARVPTDIAGDVRSDARLDVETAEKRLGVNERCLDLYDEQNALDRVIRQQVNPSAVPIPIEADLAPHNPAELLKPAGPERRQARVVGIQEPINLLALPADVPVERQVDRLGDRSSNADGELPDMSTLQE
ncbi:MAG: hypothetical protein ACRDI2_10825 [Chloroflexota bacterium]